MSASTTKVEGDVPVDPKPMIKPMNKPAIKRRKLHKRSTKAQKAPAAAKAVVTSSNVAARAAQLGAQKRVGELDKKVEALLKTNQQLKERKETMREEMEALRRDLNAAQVERDCVQQYWLRANNDTAIQHKYANSVEQRLHKTKTAHCEQINLLRQRLRTVLLNARLCSVTSTQTETILPSSGVQSDGVQTVDEWSAQKAADTLRVGDQQLARQIAELAKHKLQAQSELKFALVQLEQRMREENDAEIRRLKDEKEKQLEEILRGHRAQLTAAAEESSSERARSEDHIHQLQMEVQLLNEKVEDYEREVRSLRGDLQTANAENAILRTENASMKKDAEKREFDTTTHIKDLSTIRQLKAKLAKSEEIQEIILGEFRRLELERDDLANALSDGIRRVKEVNRQKASRLADELANAELYADNICELK